MSEELILGATPNTGPEQKEKRKISKSETGHAINLANLGKLITYCTGFGSDYNPGNPAITLLALQAKQTAANLVFTLLNNLVALYIIATDKREIAFNPFGRLVTRILAAVMASNVSLEFIKDVKTITRKLHGKRAKPIQPLSGPPAVVPEGEITKNISSSQMSYDNRIENFHKLIQLLENEPNYNPNEPELSIAGLNAHYNFLKSFNNEVVDAKTNAENKRIERNEVFYNTTTGLVQIANESKNYIKSLYGALSQQYKLVRALKFKAGADLANKLK